MTVDNLLFEDDFGVMDDIPMMPMEYAGGLIQKSEYVDTVPRKWTQQEIQWLKDMKGKGYTPAQIAVSMQRSPVSVSIKLKRLGKGNNTYNADHVKEKYEINHAFVNEINPKSVLDLYCGDKKFYNSCGIKTVTNDKNPNIEADYHMDAFKCACLLYANNKKFDLVDLDPFGSAYDCFDIAIKMAQKGLIITLGELGHKRWRRLDYVERYYGITTLGDFSIDNIISHIQSIGRRNKKNLVVYSSKEWRHIGRVWFKIEPLKITSQWNEE